MAVLKVIELMASSEKSWEDASAKAISKASKTIKGIKSAWVKDQSLACVDGKVTEFRVTLKVSFEIQ